MLGQEGARQGRVGLRDGIEPKFLQCPESEQATGRWLRTVLITKFSEAPRGWCLSDFIDSKTKKKRTDKHPGSLLSEGPQESRQVYTQNHTLNQRFSCPAQCSVTGCWWRQAGGSDREGKA